jgi:hypothetical protein
MSRHRRITADVDGLATGGLGRLDNVDFYMYVVNGAYLPVFARTGDQACLVFGPHLLYKNNGNGNSWQG